MTSAPVLRAALVAAFVAAFILSGACREPRLDAHAPSASTPPAASPAARHPSRVTLVSADEPGEPLEVRGQVFAPDGVTPAAGVTVYVYQTDLTGLYAPGGARVPRLRGWMTTDTEGRYAFRTIRPAPYPRSTIPAHVHVQLWGGGWPWQWNEDVQFADDSFLDERAHERAQRLGRFGGIHAPERDADGVQHVTHDLRLKAVGDTTEDDILHGVRDERLPGADRAR